MFVFDDKKQPGVVDNDNGSYSVSFKAATRGNYRVSVSFNGQDIKGSPFDLGVRCLSAEKSYLEVNPSFPTANQPIDLKIVAVDQDGTPLKQGSDQFRASVTFNGQPHGRIVSTELFYFRYHHHVFIVVDRLHRRSQTSRMELTRCHSLLQ